MTFREASFPSATRRAGSSFIKGQPEEDLLIKKEVFISLLGDKDIKLWPGSIYFDYTGQESWLLCDNNCSWPEWYKTDRTANFYGCPILYLGYKIGRLPINPRNHLLHDAAVFYFLAEEKVVGIEATPLLFEKATAEHYVVYDSHVDFWPKNEKQLTRNMY